MGRSAAGSSNGADATQNFARSGASTFLTGVAFDDKDGDRFYDPGEGLGKVNVSITSSAGAAYQTTTWDAGGYQIALPTGDYTVTFSGGGLAASVTKAAKIGSANVKLDLARLIHDECRIPWERVAYQQFGEGSGFTPRVSPCLPA